MSIAILGAGRIGSAFAYHLARDGHDVTVVARPGSARLAQLRRDDAIVLNTGERAAVRVAHALDEQTDFDLVAVTTLAHQVDALLPALSRSRARAIQFMFNIFNPERLAAAMGERRCSFGMPFVMATLDDEGRLGVTISASRKTLHGDRRWAELFVQAGLPSSFEPDMPLWLRCHAPLCIAMESICVRARRRGGGATWGDAMIVARGLRGGFTIIEGLGWTLYPKPKHVIAATPTAGLAALLWSVSRIPSFRDLLASGEQECGDLIEAMAVAAGGRAGLAAAAQALRNAKP